jgi:DNA damage-binding protein 1
LQGHSNLLTFRLNETIETAASFGLHEDVVRFRPGSLAPPLSAQDVLAPDLLFATTEGRLGMIGELTSAAARTMDDLQRNMARLIKGPGIEWQDWRKGGSELIKRETAGFIDADL